MCYHIATIDGINAANTTSACALARTENTWYSESLAALEYNHARYVAAILYITRNRSTQAKGAACCCVGTPHTTQRGERRRHSGAADPRLNRGCCIDSPLSLLSGCSVRTFEQSARLEILGMHGNTEKSTRLEILWMHGTEKTSTCQRRRGVQMMTRLG